MWLKRDVFVSMINASTMANTIVIVLERQNAVLQTNLDWMRVRVTQLEKERAQFLFDRTGIRIPIPEISAAPPVGEHFNELPHFEDVGEDEAKRLGIRHQDDGTLLYTK